MKDFLTNLLARNLEPTTEIRPRLASLYEPPRLAGGVLQGPAANSIIGPEASAEIGPQELAESFEPLSLDSQAQNSEHSRAVNLRSTERESSAPRVTPGRRRMSLSAMLASESGVGSQPPTNSSRLVASVEQSANWSNDLRQHEPSAKASLPSSISQATERASAPRAQDEAASRRVLEASNSSAATPRPGAHVVDEAARASLSSSRPYTPEPLRPPTLVPEANPSESLEARSPLGPIVRPQVTRSRETDARRESQAAQMDQPAPVINVTIGRIEVRASPSPETKSRPRGPQTPAATSLDEYLRQRAQGVKR